MFVSPMNIELGKLVKKKRFNFDTPKKLYGNLLFIATDSYDDYTEVINSDLFKPQQLYCVYSPRRIKPMNRITVTINQKDDYDIIREKTNGFLHMGKAMTSSYAGKNLVYNIIPEYTETYKLLSSIKKGDLPQHVYMTQYLQNLISDKVDDFNYERAYIIVPMTKYIPELRMELQRPQSKHHEPGLEILRAIKNGTLDKDKMARVDRIFFYVPGVSAMVAVDPKDENLEKDFLTEYFVKINRLNNYVGKLDKLDDISENDVETEEDHEENTKEKIKELVISNISKKLNANLSDFDAASMEERNVISAIDKKIDSYLSKDENVAKPFNNLVAEVEQDKDVTMHAINYVQSKKMAQKQTIQLSKNIAKETEIINSIEDLSDETNKFVEPEHIKAKLPGLNEKVQVSSLIALDDKYNKTQAKQDLVSCIAAFSDQDYLPLTINSWKLEDTSDDFTFKETLSVQYKTSENKTLSFKIDLPIVFDGHYIKVKGNNYIIQKQLCRLPIVKTTENNVEIVTNFNKITCTRLNGKLSRRNECLKKILQEHKSNPAYEIEYGYNIEINAGYHNDIEYEEMSSFLSRIKSMKYDIHTNRPDVEKEFSLLPYPEEFKITDTMTPVGFELGSGDERNLIYIDNNSKNVYVARPVDGGVSTVKLSDNLFTFIVKDILHDNPNKEKATSKAYAYSTCKFICVTYPIFVFCGLCEGITTTLRKAHVRYKLSNTKLPHTSDMVEVKFKNKWLYYEDTIENTLLLNILYALRTEERDYEDFDTDAPYVDYLVNVLGQPIYVKQTVRINISKLIDPITRDVLNYLKLPTDPFELLLLSNKMLTTNSYISKNDLCNYRVRGNELIYAMLYEIIAKAYYKYQNAKLNGSNKEKLDIGQNELLATLISQQNINIASQLNPVLEVEASSSCSMKGFKGVNLREAYTTELRSFDKSMNGILAANSTPFSGAVGIQRSLTVNPKINHVRGYIPKIDQSTLDATNRLSASELLSFTTATSSDAPRAAMQVGQAKHGVPVYVTHRQLIGSGYDRSMPYMISDNFCFKAKKDGVVEEINDKEKIAILKYVDGTYDAIDLREALAKNSNSGFYINQTYTIKYEAGESFHAGDVIAYNPSFFTGKGNDCAYTQATLAKCCISPGDFVFEDATYISERLSEKCASDITMAKPVALGPNAIIHNIAKVGDHIDVNEELLEFTTSFDDPTTTEFLQDLLNSMGEQADEVGNEKVLSKYSGRISDIDIYYNVPFETLSESLQKLIKEYNSGIERRKRELTSKGIKPAAIHLKAMGQQTETKINGTEFEGVLIIFYVTHKDELRIGDKLTYGVALKGIVSKIATEEEAIRSDFRPDEIVDGCNAASGVPSRMTMDIFYQLYSNKLLVELGRWIHEEWNK